MKKTFFIITIIVIAIALFSIAIFYPKDQYTQPFEYIVSDAREIVRLCLLYESNLPADYPGDTIALDDALSGASEEFRKIVERRIAAGEIIYFPPSSPVYEADIVCIVRWKNILVTVNGITSYQAYVERQ